MRVPGTPCCFRLQPPGISPWGRVSTPWVSVPGEAQRALQRGKGSTGWCDGLKQTNASATSLADAFGRAALNPSGESNAGGCSESGARSYAAGPGSRNGTLQFSRARKRWKKPDHVFQYPALAELMQGVWRHSAQIVHKNLSAAPGRLSPPPRFSPWGQSSALGIGMPGRSAPRASGVKGVTGCGERNVSRSFSNSLVGAPGRKDSILAEQARASRDHAPRFLWQWKPWKSQTTQTVSGPGENPRKGSGAVPAHIVCKRPAGIRLESHRNQARIQTRPGSGAAGHSWHPPPWSCVSFRNRRPAPHQPHQGNHTHLTRVLPAAVGAAIASVGNHVNVTVPQFIAVADSPDLRSGPGPSTVNN